MSVHSFSHAFIFPCIHFPMDSFSHTFILPISTLYKQGITPAMARAKCYHTMDAFMKLVVVLVRYSGDAANTVTKVNLLNKVGTSPCDTRLTPHETLSSYTHVHVHVFMRGEKEGRKKQARSNKQQGKAPQHAQGSHFSKEK